MKNLNSAYTSINHVPAVFKKYKLGRMNLDFGGGKYDTASKYLYETEETINLVYDPYNRSKEHNKEMLTELFMGAGVNSITCLNVLNVIQSKRRRTKVLKEIREMVYWHVTPPVVIFQIYEGNRSGIPSEKTVQTNMKTVEYIPEIQKVFPEWEVQRQGNVLIV